MKDLQAGVTCQHGQLARQCEICERDKKIECLEDELEKLRKQQTAAPANEGHHVEKDAWLPEFCNTKD